MTATRLPIVLFVAAFVALLAMPARPTLGASFVVNTLADDPTIALQCSGAPGDCSLRGAITRANLGAPGDVITFSVSGTISIASALPALTAGGDTIDATGASVTIQGAEARTFSCLSVSSASNTVKGLSITDCDNAIQLDAAASDNNTLGPGITLFDNYNGIYVTDASASGNTIIGNKLGTNAAGTAIPPEGANFASNIVIYGSNNTVGGTSAANRNVISGAGVGIWLPGTANQVYGNYIGTDVTGTLDLGNVDSGIEISSGGNSNTIGGLLAGQGNLISGNEVSNIYLTGGFGGGGSSNVVEGNIIGPTATGTGTLTSGDGVDITFGASGNIIGPGNVISDSNFDAFFISGVGTSGNVIKGNLIGTNLAGTAALPNGDDGIEISGSASSNIVGGINPGEGNVIAFNIGHGVNVIGSSTLGNSIRQNSIHDNALQGIALVSGGNGSLAAPLITAAGLTSGTACPNCAIDIFSDYTDEGQTWEGSVYADGSGNWTYFGPVTGPNITATATNGLGSTSQFSSAFACGDSDGDTVSNCADSDDDNDGFDDDAESGIAFCKNGTNDDSFEAETTYFVNDGCPAIGISETNCGGNLDNDADGYPNDGCPKDGNYSEAQFRIGTGSLDPCGVDAWPADLDDQALSFNVVNVLDLTIFVVPVRRLSTSPQDTNFNKRWDVVPGPAAPGSPWIDVLDLTQLVLVAPPMLGGLRAFNGPSCPYPP